MDYYVLMYSDEINHVSYDTSHPFRPERAKVFKELLERFSLLHEDNQKIVKPEPLDEGLLELFHTPYYLDLLKKTDDSDYSIEMLEAGLGSGDNPIFPGLYHFNLVAAGATHQGAMMLANNEAKFVFNPTRGFHHAGKDHAAGFCYVNDIAITIRDLLNRGKRVAYIDIDVHHGNGVQEAFYKEKDILTISLHESGYTLYPWSGFENQMGANSGLGYNINIPFLKGTDDEVYIYAFESIVPPLVKKFNPDLLFLQMGGDSHREDPIAHLKLTSNGYGSVIKMIHDLEFKTIAVGGGGYNVIKTASLWAHAWSIFCNVKPMDLFGGILGGKMHGPEWQVGSLDDEPFVAGGHDKDASFEHTKAIVEFIKQKAFPIHGL